MYNCSCTYSVTWDQLAQYIHFTDSRGTDLLSDSAADQLYAVINSLDTCIADSAVTATLISNDTLKHSAHYDKCFALNLNGERLYMRSSFGGLG